ncbi:2Fe-2S iron-sulfur cluster-binding protein [Streptomyces sp. NPDC001858]
MLFSCREGTCGTCETDVLNGTSDHRDSTLDEDERPRTTPCRSASRVPAARLVFDL